MIKAPIWTRLTLSIVLVVAAWWMAGRLNLETSSQADVQASITITQPDGVHDVVGEGDG